MLYSETSIEDMVTLTLNDDDESGNVFCFQGGHKEGTRLTVFRPVHEGLDATNIDWSVVRDAEVEPLNRKIFNELPAPARRLDVVCLAPPARGAAGV